MKLCYGALAILLVCAHIPAGTPAMSRQAIQSTKNMVKNVCKNKTGVKQELLTAAGKGEFSTDRKLKCYISCVLGMVQAMKGNKIQIESARKQAEALLPEDMRDVTLKQLEACKHIVGEDACDVAYDFAMCAWDTEPINHLIPT